MTRAPRRRAAPVAPAAPAAPAAAPPAPLLEDPPAFQLLNEVGILGQLSSHHAAALLAPELNLPQFAVLNHFTRLGGERSPVQLAAAMQVTKGAMTNTIARLQAKGLVQVLPDPADGRGKRVVLTPAGRAARQQAVRLLAQGLAALDGVVDERELLAALAVLRQLRVWFDTHR